MKLTVQERVELGSAWLDGHYPGWWKVIDLSTLNISSCHECVLGQVYTGCIPTSERGELIAQAAANAYHQYPNSRAEFISDAMSGYEGGYRIIRNAYDLEIGDAHRYGFTSYADDEVAEQAFRELTEAWTVKILSRRLENSPEYDEDRLRLDALRELAHI